MDPPPGLDLALPPFSLLDAAGRARLLDSLDMGFHPAGEILMSAGQPSAHVYVLLKGQARAYDLDQDGREQPFADYGPGEVFGAWAAITGSASYHFRASTVCLSFLIPTPVFRSLVADQPAFAAYFSERLSVRGQLAEPSRPEQAELMLAQAGDAQLAPVERVPAGASIAQAAARLRERQVDCLLVDDPDHPDPGIVTRTDLLEALTLRQLPLDAAVGPLASRPLVGVEAGEALFQALTAMTERHIERVVVRRGDQVAGTLGMAEVLSHYANHSHLISLRLARATTLAEVADAARDMTRLVRTLHAQGARIAYLMELVSALNSRVMSRIFELVVPAEFHDRLCLLVMGSEGRREQLLKTDQDNALIVADTLDWPGLAAAMDAFSAALADVGYPPCPGQVMVNNPHWRMTTAQWRQRIGQWRHDYTGQAPLDLSIALDARAIAGNRDLFAPVQQGLMSLGQDDMLLHHLARATLNFETPLTLLGNVKGDGRGTDLKKGGIFPVVHGLRCLALRHGIEARNSFDRCRELAAAGVLSAALGRDLPQALAVFQRLRLDAQLDALDQGQVPDNFVVAERLRRLDRELLRDALRVAKDFRQHVRLAFHLTD